MHVGVKYMCMMGRKRMGQTRYLVGSEWNGGGYYRAVVTLCFNVSYSLLSIFNH